MFHDIFDAFIEDELIDLVSACGCKHIRRPSRLYEVVGGDKFGWYWMPFVEGEEEPFCGRLACLTTKGLYRSIILSNTRLK